MEEEIFFKKGEVVNIRKMKIYLVSSKYGRRERIAIFLIVQDQIKLYLKKKSVDKILYICFDEEIDCESFKEIIRIELDSSLKDNRVKNKIINMIFENFDIININNVYEYQKLEKELPTLLNLGNYQIIIINTISHLLDLLRQSKESNINLLTLNRFSSWAKEFKILV